MKEALDALTAWGMQGYDVVLHFGMTWGDGAARVGWSCMIRYLPTGTVIIGNNRHDPHGFHTTDPITAARDALRMAGERWPETVERMTQ